MCCLSLAAVRDQGSISIQHHFLSNQVFLRLSTTVHPATLEAPVELSHIAATTAGKPMATHLVNLRSNQFAQGEMASAKQWCLSFQPPQIINRFGFFFVAILYHRMDVPA
jgi:hypothetical protein